MALHHNFTIHFCVIFKRAKKDLLSLMCLMFTNGIFKIFRMFDLYEVLTLDVECSHLSNINPVSVSEKK